MPFLDRSRIPGGAHYRPMFRALFYAFAIRHGGAGIHRLYPPADQSILIGQVATFIYFTLSPVAAFWPGVGRAMAD